MTHTKIAYILYTRERRGFGNGEKARGKKQKGARGVYVLSTTLLDVAFPCLHLNRIDQLLRSTYLADDPRGLADGRR